MSPPRDATRPFATVSSGSSTVPLVNGLTMNPFAPRASAACTLAASLHAVTVEVGRDDGKFAGGIDQDGEAVFRLAQGPGSVALLIKQRNFPGTAQCLLNWTDHSCQRIKLFGERHYICAIDRELALADHVHELDSGEYGSRSSE